MGGDGGGGEGIGGEVLRRRFDRRSPAVDQELAAFSEELWALEQAVAPDVLAVHATFRGEVLELRILQVRSSG